MPNPRGTTSLLNMTEGPMQAIMNRLPPSAIATLGDVHSTLRSSARRELPKRRREPNVSSNGFIGAAPNRVRRLVKTGRWPSDSEMRDLIALKRTPFEVHEYLHKRFAADRGEYPYETKYLTLFMEHRRSLTDFLKMLSIIDAARVSPEQAVDIFKYLFRHYPEIMGSKDFAYIIRTLRPVLPRVRNVNGILFSRQSYQNRYIRHLDNTNIRRLLPPAEFDNTTNVMYLNSDTIPRLTRLGYPIRPTSMVFARDFYTKANNNQTRLMGMATLQNTPESRIAALDRLLAMPQIDIPDLKRLSILLRHSHSTRPTVDNALRFILLVENHVDKPTRVTGAMIHTAVTFVEEAKAVFQQMVARNPNLKTDRRQLNATEFTTLKRHLMIARTIENEKYMQNRQSLGVLRLKTSFYNDALRTLGEL